jgi:hypothetical protein
VREQFQLVTQFIIANEMQFPEAVKTVVKRISDEETRHATAGYFLSALLCKSDYSRVLSAQNALKLIREIEPLDYSNTAKLFKQNASEKILLEYTETGDWIGATQKIIDYAAKAEEGILL